MGLTKTTRGEQTSYLRLVMGSMEEHHHYGGRTVVTMPSALRLGRHRVAPHRLLRGLTDAQRGRVDNDGRDPQWFRSGD